MPESAQRFRTTRQSVPIATTALWDVKALVDVRIWSLVGSREFGDGTGAEWLSDFR